VGGGADGRAPLAAGERGEKRGRGSGPRGPEAGMGHGVGRWVGFVFFFSFQILFKSFSNPFKIQIFYTNFHKYFKTFKTTPRPKLMHSNHDAQGLIASKLLK
jgi:hypothetical protein